MRFDPWVWKILWRRAWQPIPVFLPGESHGQRSLAGYVHRVAKSQTPLKSDLARMHACMSTTEKQPNKILFLKSKC